MERRQIQNGPELSPEDVEQREAPPSIQRDQNTMIHGTEEQTAQREKEDWEELEIVDQDPGHRQKQNQNDQEEDPLAA